MKRSSPGKVQEAFGCGRCRNTAGAGSNISFTHQAVIKDTRGQIWRKQRVCFLTFCLQQVIQFSALTHLAPFSSSSHAQREETACGQRPGCPAGRSPAAGEPQVTGVWRVKRQSAVRPATSSSWPLQSHRWWQTWRRRPAGVFGRCCRSVGSSDAEHREPPRCTALWCQHHSNLRDS